MDYYKNQSYYDILGVESTASIESIEKAKNRLKFGDSDSRAPFSMWDKIDEAYVVLSNPTKRSEYDAQLQQTVQDNEPKTNNNIDNNIYSSSDHKIHSLVNNEEEKNNLLKFKKIIGNFVFALPIGVLTVHKIINKIENGELYCLQEKFEECEIEEVKTEESQLEEKYRKELEENIDRKLRKYCFNYDLEIDKLRYENHIELLKSKIMVKKNQVIQKGGLLKYKFELKALIKQLEIYEKNLQIVKEKISKSYETQKKQKLTKLHERLFEVDKLIKSGEMLSNKRSSALVKLQIRKRNLKQKLNLKIDKVKSSRDWYAVFKDSFLSAQAETESFFEILVDPLENIKKQEIDNKKEGYYGFKK